MPPRRRGWESLRFLGPSKMRSALSCQGNASSTSPSVLTRCACQFVGLVAIECDDDVLVGSRPVDREFDASVPDPPRQFEHPLRSADDWRISARSPSAWSPLDREPMPLTVGIRRLGIALQRVTRLTGSAFGADAAPIDRLPDAVSDVELDKPGAAADVHRRARRRIFATIVATTCTAAPRDPCACRCRGGCRWPRRPSSPSRRVGCTSRAMGRASRGRHRGGRDATGVLGSMSSPQRTHVTVPLWTTGSSRWRIAL